MATYRALFTGLCVAAWLATTWVFWLGYAGADDIFYARYAHLWQRPPMNWWEFRMPAILAMRAAFLAFGTSEFTAALPTLIASLALLAAVAWMSGALRQPDWTSLAAVLLVVTLPLDVGFRSWPGAPYLAGALVALGTACMLKGGRKVQLLGSALLALGFTTHEITIFYIALFCLTALAFDRRRYIAPVAACIALAALILVVECVTYRILLGDALARWHNSAGNINALPLGYDPDTKVHGVRFFTWPLELLFFSKQLGFDLILLLAAGVRAWRWFNREQRILFVTTFLTWAWLGYGTMVPWSYRPLYRQLHYYVPLELGLATLLPAAIGYAFRERRRAAHGLIGLIIAVHLLLSAAGGRWGQDVNVSRQLLRYAMNHRHEVFVTDVGTMNSMYALQGFHLPENVSCINGSAVKRYLLLNKEPAGTPRFEFAERKVDGILLNLERPYATEVEPEFARYLREHKGTHIKVAPVRYKLLFLPLTWLTGARPFMVRNEGGEVIRFASGTVQ